MSVFLPQSPAAAATPANEAAAPLTDVPAATDPYRRAAWQRYRAAAYSFACQPEDPAAAEALAIAAEGLRRAAAVTAWRRG